MNVGGLILIAIAVIVGLILLQASAQNIGDVTNTISVANQSETLAANGESIYIEEYRALSNVVIINSTGEEVIGAGNYTVTNNVINPTTGALSTQITTDDAEYAEETVGVSGTAQPLTYDNSSGGRAIAGLIVLLMALAIMLVVVAGGVKGWKG